MQVDDMKKDLQFKQGQLDNSATTAAQLKVQKEYINKDLEKVKSLEFRISNKQVGEQLFNDCFNIVWVGDFIQQV